MKESLVFAYVICAQLLKRLAAGCDDVIARNRSRISVCVFVTDVTGRNCNENDRRVCVPDCYFLILGRTFATGCNNQSERFKIQPTFDAEGIQVIFST